eukprot:CAMPEP_0204543966 /NCGR_PEP_ID=MMETSP0661-20131031/20169_1 /ASSEMBLY_ACC=CAM_ASM_000606 /TAXON_ID=109239 /ORGANISM="Alexandrium margalefi, Strain AMGDE01CS-322" /LENGTH=123 /DNA_ID=CAMNT_0051550705 /DNA_START=39 /DNA_END=407 /DNA_ORIENTATION=-
MPVGLACVCKKVVVDDRPDDLFRILVRCRALDLADLLRHEVRSAALAADQLGDDDGEQSRQVYVEGRHVEAVAPALHVVRGELDRPFALPINVDEPSLLVVSGNQDVVQVVEVKCLNSHERQI